MEHSTQNAGESFLLDQIEREVAAAPEDAKERAARLRNIHEQLENGVRLVQSALQQALFQSATENLDTEAHATLLKDIASRQELSAEFGVDSDDLQFALNSIGENTTVLGQLIRLGKTGAEMTISSVDESEIVLIDTVDELQVAAQGESFVALQSQERTNAANSLVQRLPALTHHHFNQRRRAAPDKGVNYYECLLLGEAIGVEPITRDEYDMLQAQKTVDKDVTVSWLFTDNEVLRDGQAFRGTFRHNTVQVKEAYASERNRVRAGRYRLRVPVR